MKRIYLPVGIFVLGMALFSCSQKTSEKNSENMEIVSEIGDIKVDRFADVQVLRYEIKDFDKLTLNQKKLVYYLSQAGLAGRDINYDQNNPYNIRIRKALEAIFENYKGERSGNDWNNFEVYAKQVWFSNGIHHHYGMDKFNPKFSKDYFQSLLKAVNHTLDTATLEVMFNPEIAKSRKIKDPKQDIIVASANGFYGDDACRITRYAGMNDKLTSIGFYEFNPAFDRNGQTALLLAQMVWYFIDGFYNRKQDFPLTPKSNYIIYRATLKDGSGEMTFVKSKRSDRWWLQVPYPSNGSGNERYHLVPCRYEDYNTAVAGEIPDLWWRTCQKLA